MSIEPMESKLYACVHADEFPAQALIRMRGELEAEPVAVVEGRPPLETVCSLNRLARLKGAELGMTKLEAESLAGLRLVARSVECEAAARAVYLECAAHFSPRIEDASRGTGAHAFWTLRERSGYSARRRGWRNGCARPTPQPAFASRLL